jgi:uncharacterized RDD family membrane protein YckC
MGRRIVAFVIDILIIGIVVSIFFRPSISTVEGVTSCSQVVLEGHERCLESSGTDVTIVDYNLFGAVMMQLGLWFLNATLLQGVTGATVGKTILGLRCVKANGEICGLGPAFIRTVALIVDYAFCFLIGLVTASVSKGHRRLGDMAAGTYVIKVSSLDALRSTPPASQVPQQPATPAPPEWRPPGPEAPPRGPGSPPPWSPN